MIRKLMMTVFGVLMALSLATPATAQDNVARGLAIQAGSRIDAMLPVRGIPEILIAPANAPARVRKVADYLLTGVSDDVMVQAVINACPTVPDAVRSKVLVTGGKTCSIRFAEGKVNFSNFVTIPAGSVIDIHGAGVSSWRPIDPRPDVWEGGTIIYSRDPSGRVLQYPQYTGFRTDSGLTNTIPASGVVLENIEIRVFNPATTQAFSSLNLDGMTTGIVRNVNVFGDLGTNTQPRISAGISVQSGARSDRKIFSGVAAFGFRDAGILINTTHIDANQLVSGEITGGTSPACFQISQDQNLRLYNLHAFSCSIGAKVSGTAPLNISSIMFESVTTPVLLQQAGATNVQIDSVILNSDVPWTGDITSKVRVLWLGGCCYAAQPRISNSGQATIVAGQTSVTVAHGLFVAPRTYNATTNTAGAPAATITSDATNVVISIPSAQGTSTLVSWSANASGG